MFFKVGNKSTASRALSMQPCAPTSSECGKSCLGSCWLMIRILTSGDFSLKRRAVFRPFVPGILTSSKIRLGFNSSALLSVSSASEASPHTSNSFSPDSTVAMPRRTSSLSSAMRTLMDLVTICPLFTQQLARAQSSSVLPSVWFWELGSSRIYAYQNSRNRYSSCPRTDAAFLAFL